MKTINASRCQTTNEAKQEEAVRMWVKHVGGSIKTYRDGFILVSLPESMVNNDGYTDYILSSSWLTILEDIAKVTVRHGWGTY